MESNLKIDFHLKDHSIFWRYFADYSRKKCFFKNIARSMYNFIFLRKLLVDQRNDRRGEEEEREGMEQYGMNKPDSLAQQFNFIFAISKLLSKSLNYLYPYHQIIYQSCKNCSYKPRRQTKMTANWMRLESSRNSFISPRTHRFWERNYRHFFRQEKYYLHFACLKNLYSKVFLSKEEEKIAYIESTKRSTKVAYTKRTKGKQTTWLRFLSIPPCFYY